MILNSDYAKTFWSSQPQKCWYSICHRNEFHGARIPMSLFCPQGWKLKLNSSCHCVWLHSIALKQSWHTKKNICFHMHGKWICRIGMHRVQAKAKVDNVLENCVWTTVWEGKKTWNNIEVQIFHPPSQHLALGFRSVYTWSHILFKLLFFF